MVDALNRAREWLKPPHGIVIDLRPADVVPYVEIGLADGGVHRVGGLTVDDERRERHRAADSALGEVVARGLFTVEDEVVFSFYYYPHSADELRDYLAAKWRHTRLDDETHGRAVDTMRAHPGSRLWLCEQVAIRTLRPARVSASAFS
jgi:hypothetical protein